MIQKPYNSQSTPTQHQGVPQKSPTPPKTISAQLVSQDEVKEARKAEVESAKVDGVNNVILVDQTEEGEAIISNIEVEDISAFQIGNEAQIGSAKGKIVFIDDGFDDDKQLQKTKEPQGEINQQSKQAQLEADQARLEKIEDFLNQSVAETQATQGPAKKPPSIYNLSATQAFKFVSVLNTAISIDNYGGAATELKRLNKLSQQEFGSGEKKAQVKDFQEKRKLGNDGNFGKQTFLAAKAHYLKNSGLENEKKAAFTDQDFKDLINHAIEVYDDPQNKLSRFMDIWDLYWN